MNQPSVTIQENAVGFCSAQGVIDVKHAGYTGAGFVDTENVTGSSIEWQVSVDEANMYTATVRFANGGGSARSGLLTANGNEGTGALYTLASGSWTTWDEESQEIVLNNGTNRLVLRAQSADGLANIDSITIVGPGVTAETCSGSSSSSSSSSSSTSSSSTSSSSSSSSSTGAPVTVRPAKLEGFGRNTTGGAGGLVVTARTGTEINQAMCDRPTQSTPIIIYVDGTINHGNTTAVGCNTAADVIEIKGRSNISIIGVDNRAVFDQMGIHLRDASNIILQNLNIKNVKKSGTPTSNGGDAIGMESGVTNVWVDHNELHASGGETDGYDSLIDMKATVTNVTVSYNYLHDSGRGGLMGSSDSDSTNTDVTFHHNWYENIDSRTPLLRHGLAHSYNNYFNGISKSGMNPRIGGRIKAEHNHFENAKNPIGTFYTTDMGFWDLNNNYFDPATVTWEAGSESFPAGPNPMSTISIRISYPYTLDPVSQTKDIVKANAGVGKIKIN